MMSTREVVHLKLEGDHEGRGAEGREPVQHLAGGTCKRDYIGRPRSLKRPHDNHSMDQDRTLARALM